MDSSTERRAGQRLFLGPEHSIHFLLKGHAFREIRITNVGLGGCFAMVPLGDKALFGPGALLEQLAFDHPDLPPGPITARVCYAVGTQSGLEFMGVGIEFIAMAPETRERLAVFIEASLP